MPSPWPEQKWARTDDYRSHRNFRHPDIHQIYLADGWSDGMVLVRRLAGAVSGQQTSGRPRGWRRAGERDQMETKYRQWEEDTGSGPEQLAMSWVW
jgi:hypothetical protein